MWLLLAGGVVGGFSNDFTWVLAARVAEGLAAGIVQPIPAIIILRAFEPHEQGRASGIFGMGVVLAPAIGPSIGGVLVDLFGWRSIFFMVVPFCLASIWLAYKFVPTTAPGGVTATRAGGLDWRGLLIGLVGTLCLLNGLVELHGGTAWSATLLLGAAVALVTTFVVVQRRTLLARRRHPHQGIDPLMNLSLFRDQRFAMGSVVSFIYGVALFGSTYLLPVYMLLGLGLSASYVGTILLPSGLVLAVCIALVGRLLADKQPTHRLVSFGLALLAASFALMVTIKVDQPARVIPLLVTWAILGRIGLGFILPSLNIGAMRGLDRTHIPQGASVINFVRMLGGATGVSLCGIALEWRIAAHGTSLIGPNSPARMAAFDETFLMLAAVCALAMLAALRLKPARHERHAGH
jgi:predicted MFS family arabinose efflux permease